MATSLSKLTVEVTFDRSFTARFGVASAFSVSVAGASGRRVAGRTDRLSRRGLSTGVPGRRPVGRSMKVLLPGRSTKLEVERPESNPSIGPFARDSARLTAGLEDAASVRGSRGWRDGVESL